MEKKIRLTHNQLKHILKESVNEVLNNFITDIKDYTKNNSSLVSLNENNAIHLINKHTKDGYVIVSPCKGYDFLGLDKNNPKDVEKKHHIDHLRIKKLIAQIKNANLSYTPVYAGSPEEDNEGNIENVYETSFIIYPYDKNGNKVDFEVLKKFVFEVCEEYDQDSVLIKEPNNNPKYVTSNGDVDMEFKDKTKFNDMLEPYFTDLHNGKNKGDKHSRFIFKEAYINPAPQSYSERHIRYLNGEVFLTD